MRPRARRTAATPRAAGNFTLGWSRLLQFAGDALALKHRRYEDRGDLHAGENDFKAAWQGVVAQARKAEEAQGRGLAVVYAGGRQLVAVRHDALVALQLANRPPRYFRRAGRVSRPGVNPKPGGPPSSR